MLTIDIGNSRIKWALFKHGVIREHGVFEYRLDSLQADFKNANLPVASERVEISCVAGQGFKKRFSGLLNSYGYTNFRFAETMAKQCNVINSYKVPENMGVDRWLAMVEAFRVSGANEGEVVCVIDCGTAITLDVISDSGQHLGGLIMPGYRTMINSLVTGAENIEYSEKNHSNDDVTGLASSTQDSISKGCSQVIAGGLSAIIDSHLKCASMKIHCIVTGGDGGWVSSAITYENSHNPFLVLQGLYTASTEIKK
ncbi:MAG: hypothetical protein DIZ80_02570 [endosymbiont of Galathealinum brachiosum]|uniref:Type III pantothenate kinase n=1 Tax=endosymbiont of Galathealinum brachiosum TaxID=2200906 RepID=A0A370DJU5_9GAMM|nr:MAG: hypothetical protein DIZ80_02570 [endosymbiont of Galathealinum brachiosum]